MSWIQEHWYTIGITAWAVLQFLMNGIANSLDAPTAQDTPQYRFWFKFVNYCALNAGRAKNNAAIEQSPNFIPAAEAYMQKKLAENGRTN